MDWLDDIKKSLREAGELDPRISEQAQSTIREALSVRVDDAHEQKKFGDYTQEEYNAIVDDSDAACAELDEGDEEDRILRVLVIPHEAEKDSKGRGIGDDWLLADMGTDEDGNHIYVTTDRVHASEMAGMALLSPRELAVYLAENVNASWRRYLKRKEKKA